jgi:hypothetical protein
MAEDEKAKMKKSIGVCLFIMIAAADVCSTTILSHTEVSSRIEMLKKLLGIFAFCIVVLAENIYKYYFGKIKINYQNIIQNI